MPESRGTALPCPYGLFRFMNMPNMLYMVEIIESKIHHLAFLDVLKERWFWIAFFLQSWLASPFFYLIGRRLRSAEGPTVLLPSIILLLWLSATFVVFALMKRKGKITLLSTIFTSLIGFLIALFFLQQSAGVVEALVFAPIFFGAVAMSPYGATLSLIVFYTIAIISIVAAHKLSVRILTLLFGIAFLCVLFGLQGCVYVGMNPVRCC